MSVEEFIEQLKSFPQDMDVKLLAVNKYGYYSEPRLVSVNGKVLILNGKLEVVDNA